MSVASHLEPLALYFETPAADDLALPLPPGSLGSFKKKSGTTRKDQALNNIGLPRANAVQSRGKTMEQTLVAIRLTQKRLALGADQLELLNTQAARARSTSFQACCS
jgi:hypothetical protein